MVARDSGNGRPRKSFPLAQRGRRTDPRRKPLVPATAGHARDCPLRSAADAWMHSQRFEACLQNYTGHNIRLEVKNIKRGPDRPQAIWHSGSCFRQRPATQELPLAQRGRRTDANAVVARDSGNGRPRKSFPLAQRGRRTDPRRKPLVPATAGHARDCPLRSAADAWIHSQRFGTATPDPTVPRSFAVDATCSPQQERFRAQNTELRNRNARLIHTWRFHCSTFFWQTPGWIHFLPSLSVF